jgi:DNA-dependent RNA polymerase auxiliary subunit epsilon
MEYKVLYFAMQEKEPQKSKTQSLRGTAQYLGHCAYCHANATDVMILIQINVKQSVAWISGVQKAM